MLGLQRILALRQSSFNELACLQQASAGLFSGQRFVAEEPAQQRGYERNDSRHILGRQPREAEFGGGLENLKIAHCFGDERLVDRGEYWRTSFKSSA